MTSLMISCSFKFIYDVIWNPDRLAHTDLYLCVLVVHTMIWYTGSSRQVPSHEISNICWYMFLIEIQVVNGDQNY